MRALTRHHQGTTHQRVKNTPSRSCVFMMDTAADDSELNQEQGRASEFAPSSTMKPFAAAVDGNANSHQRLTTNSNATPKDAAAVVSPSSGVASSITNVPGGPRKGQISLHFDLSGLASQGLAGDSNSIDAFNAAPSALVTTDACNASLALAASSSARAVLPPPGDILDCRNCGGCPLRLLRRS